MNLKEMIEKRIGLKNQLEALLGKARTENRAMSEDESKEFDRIEAEIKRYDVTIKAELRARDIPEISAVDNGGSAGNSEPTTDEVEERAFTDFIFDRLVENRAEGTQLTKGNNGTIVPRTIASRIITKVKSLVPFFEIADVVETNGDFAVPVYGEDAQSYISADYVEEGTDLTDNVGKFTTIDLKGYVIGALSLVSKKLQNNTKIDVIGFIVNQVAQAIAVKLEREFVVGTNNKISGILSSANIMRTLSDSAIAYDSLVKLKHSIKKIFRPNARFIMHPSTYTYICTLKDENGIPYFKEEDYKILNIPVEESDSMPEIGAGNKVIAYGDFKGFTIKCTTDIEIQVLREKFATKNMLGILGFAEFDAKITDSQRISVLEMAEAPNANFDVDSDVEE